MKKSVVSLGIVIFVLAVGFFLFDQAKQKKSQDFIVQPSVSKSPTSKQDETVDYKASFAIFTNGTFRVFSGTMYHNRSDDVFIQADNPNVVLIKKSEIVWNDFFATLPFKLTKDCLTTGTGETFCSNTNSKLRFYLNGKEDSDAFDKQINDSDRLLVTYGNENEQQIQKQIQKIPAIK